MIFTLCSVAGGTSESFSCQAELIIPHNAAADFFFCCQCCFCCLSLGGVHHFTVCPSSAPLVWAWPILGLHHQHQLLFVLCESVPCSVAKVKLLFFSFKGRKYKMSVLFFFLNVCLKYGCVLVPLSCSHLNESGEDQTVSHNVNRVKNLSSSPQTLRIQNQSILIQ